MGNCLKTQLKETVNANLPYLNGIRVKFTTASSKHLKLKASESGKIKIKAVSGTFDVLGSTDVQVLAENQTEYTVNSTNRIYIKPNSSNMIVVIYGREYITEFTQGATGNIKECIVYLDDLAYMDNLNQLSTDSFLTEGLFNVATIPLLSYSKVRTYSDSSIIVPEGYFMNIGTFIAFGEPNYNFADFDLLSFSRSNNLLHVETRASTGARGSIDALCDALYGNGKTSGTVTFKVAGTKCTLHGVEQTEEVAAESGLTISVVFDENGWTATQS